jgi:hypothetical protein
MNPPNEMTLGNQNDWQMRISRDVVGAYGHLYVTGWPNGPTPQQGPTPKQGSTPQWAHLLNGVQLLNGANFSTGPNSSTWTMAKPRKEELGRFQELGLVVHPVLLIKAQLKLGFFTVFSETYECDI